MRKLVLSLVILLICFASFSQTIYSVNSTDDIDDGICDSTHCSFREALILSNSDNVESIINFNISTSNIARISFLSELPAITEDSLFIDGKTQPNNDPFNKKLVFDFFLTPTSSTGSAHFNCNGDSFRVEGIVFEKSVDSPILSINGNNCFISDSYFFANGGVHIVEVFGDCNLESNVFNSNNCIVEVQDWGSTILTNNYFGYEDTLTIGSPMCHSIGLGSNTVLQSNYFFGNLMFGPYSTIGFPGPYGDLDYIADNNYECISTLFPDHGATIFTEIDSITVDSIYGSSALGTQVEVMLFTNTSNYCSQNCSPNQYLGSYLSDINGDWSAPLPMNTILGSTFMALPIEPVLLEIGEISDCEIVLPNYCEFPNIISVSHEPCSTNGVVLDLKELSNSQQPQSSPCALTFAGNDAWYKVEVPATGNFLVRQNLNNTVEAVIEAYSGDCNNLFLEQCEVLDSVPHAITFENYAPGSFLYLRVWDKDNGVVGSASSALLHLTAHELSINKSDWELCDEENNYLVNGNPTILSERDANSFIIEYEDIATPAEIQAIRDSLILGGGSLIDSCLCGSNPLELWDHETPIEMEANKKGARLRARVDTSNYNYKFESIEFQVNAYAIGEQYNAKVDMDDEGNFVIVWIDQQRRHNYGRLYKSSGNPITQEFQIGASNKTQYEGEIAMDENGKFVTAWQEINTSVPGSNFSIFGRQYLADGSPVGPPFNISTDAICGSTSGNCVPPTGINENGQYGTNPSLDTDGNGNFIVVWNVGPDIYGQRYNSSAVKSGQVFEIDSSSIKSNSPSASVSMNASGAYIVVWTGDDTNENGIWVQRYSSIGTEEGSPIQVNSYSTMDQGHADISLADDGSFIVTWESYEQEGAGLNYGIYAQRFSATGSSIGSEIHVNTYTIDAQRHPSISVLNDGTFFIAWSSYGQDGYEEGIYGQFFDSNGNPIDSEFRLNNLVDPEQELPSTATNGESVVISTWQDGANDGSFTGIFGQRYEIIDAGGLKVYYPIGTATPSTLLGDELTYPGTIYNPSDSLASVRVAIIDTGVDPSHPYLSGAIWNNQQVNNGTTCYVNDTLGYDFVNDTPNPIDYDGHGTKVNGIIARDFPADIQLELMNLKFHEFQKGKVFDAVCAIYYAVDNGADIINMSWGFEASEYPAILKKAIQYASDNDVLLITTAGNTSKDNDKLNKFPCNLDIPHMIRVTSYEYKSSTNTKKLANYASYGKNNVDIAAYGFVETPSLGGTLELASGTSLAAPHITRTAAIIKGLFPNLTALDIKDCILNNAAPESDFTDLVSTGGILDHEAAIDCAYEKAANCVAIDLYITIPQSLDTIYRSDVWVETDATVDNNSDVEMWGADHVTMLPGFETTLGTKFLADIDDCDPLNTPVMAQGPYGSETARLRLRENSVLAGKVKVQFYFKGKKVEMNLRQHNGKTIDSYTFQPEKEGWYEKIIDAKLLETGVYELELTDGNNSEIKLFQVQNQHHQQYLNRSKKKTE